MSLSTQMKKKKKKKHSFSELIIEILLCQTPTLGKFFVRQLDGQNSRGVCQLSIYGTGTLTFQ